MSDILTSCFVLCAGKGTRMMPLTQTTPKPLVLLNERPILDYIFAHLLRSNIEKITLNGHYMADQIEEYGQTKTKQFDVSFSYEHEILETGGGMKKALYTMPHDRPFFAINGDAYWTESDGSKPALQRLSNMWDGTQMDILLLLEPVSRMNVTQGVGDYDIGDDGRLTRRKDRGGTHMFTGIRLCHSCVFDFKSFDAFSFLECMDEAEAQGRLFGLEHEGLWHHLSTPADIVAVEKSMRPHRGVDPLEHKDT